MTRNASIISFLFFAVLFVFGPSLKAQTTSNNHVENCRDETAISYVYGDGIYPNQIDIETALDACSKALDLVINEPELEAELLTRLGITMVQAQDKRGVEFLIEAHSMGNALAKAELADFYYEMFRSQVDNGNRESEIADRSLNLVEKLATEAVQMADLPNAWYLLGLIANEKDLSPEPFLTMAAELGHSNASVLWAKILQEGWLTGQKDLEGARRVLMAQRDRFKDPYAGFDLAMINLDHPRDSSDLVFAIEEIKRLVEYWEYPADAPEGLFAKHARIHLSETDFELLKSHKITNLIDRAAGFESLLKMAQNPNSYAELASILDDGAPSILEDTQKAKVISALENVAYRLAKEGVGQQAIRDGEAIEAAIFLAKLKGNGVLGPVDRQAQKKLLILAADEYGSETAALNLGWLLYSKQDIYDLELAARYTWGVTHSEDLWLRAHALNNLGVIYNSMKSVRYIDQAIKFWEEAAIIFAKYEQAPPWPSHNLARTYLFGLGSNGRDIEKASAYAKIKNRDDSKSSMKEVLDRNHITSETDERQIIEWFQQAASQGNFEALWEVGNYFWFVEEYYQAAKWFNACRMLCAEDDRTSSLDFLEKLKPRLTGKELDDSFQEASLWGLNFRQNGSINNQAKAQTGFEFKGRMFALLIGVSDYQSRTIPALSTPIRDVNQLSRILGARYGFVTEVLENPTRGAITTRLNEYQSILKSGDSFLIYFAGHGVEVAGEGFWLPTDADLEDDTNHIDHSYIRRKLSTLPATNILVISDSCFSGNITRGVEVVSQQSRNDTIGSFLTTKSRIAISSGSNEPVMDGGGGQHSLFAKSLLNVLIEADGPLTSLELYSKLRQPVISQSADLGAQQTPLFGELIATGHEGPDFVFLPN